MNEDFFFFVLDEEVDCVRFHSTESATLIYKDGSVLGLTRRERGWSISGGFSRDAATATGMYDRY